MAEIVVNATVTYMWIETRERGSMREWQAKCACGYRGPRYGSFSDAHINVGIHDKLCEHRKAPSLGHVTMTIEVVGQVGWKLPAHQFTGRSDGNPTGNG